MSYYLVYLSARGVSAWSGYGIVVWCVAIWWFTTCTLFPIITLSLSIIWLVPLWMAVTVCIYFRFRQVLFRYVRVIAYVFCHAGVLVCLFVVIVADFWYDVIKIGYNTIGYRILNCIMNLAFLIFGFYLSLGVSSKSFQSHFCCSYFVYSFLFGIGLCRLLLWLVFVCRNGTTDFAKTGQVSDDTINLINY